MVREPPSTCISLSFHSLIANACGRDEGFEEHKLLYFVLPQKNGIARTTCIKQCPQLGKVETLDCKTNSQVKSCTKNDSKDPKLSLIIYDSTPCKIFALTTNNLKSLFIEGSVLGVVCIPVKAEYYTNVQNRLIFDVRVFVKDIRVAWRILALSVVFAVFAG